MPKLIRLYIECVVVGFLIALVFTGGLLWLDVGGIGHLVLASDIGWVAALMLVVFNGIVFAAVQFAVRVMGMADDDEGPKGGHGAREPVLVPVPVPVRVTVRNRRR